MNLKELIQKANHLVHEEGHTLHELLEKNQFPAQVDAIIQIIKENENLIETPTEEDYKGLKKALEKRREISLKATYAAISHLLLPDKFPLKSLDNFNSNLQSEKKPSKENPMPESEELSQEDIEALLAGNNSANKDKKPKKEDDQLSNDDIEALLAGAKTPPKPEKKEKAPTAKIEGIKSTETSKPVSSPAKSNKAEEEFSQEEIEALLAGEPAKNTAKSNKPESDISLEDLNNLLNPGEESDQISEDDIQSLLAAQDEQDKENPLVMALNNEEDTPAIRIRGNTDKISGKNKEVTPVPSKQEMNFESTNIPQDVFPISKTVEELLLEKDKGIDNSSIKAKQPETQEKPENVFVAPSSQTKPIASTEKLENLMQSGDVKERILNDVYALYVNKNGKPVLHAECPTREEIKKAYLNAMQNYPQNSLFIEKISRKEIIVIKETKEIINLKVNISFE